jgi:hypothetical protein
MTCPLHMQLPFTVSSPPWQFDASRRTQVPPPPPPPPRGGITMKLVGQTQRPSDAVPPSQRMDSSALRVGDGSAGGKGGGTGGATATGDAGIAGGPTASAVQRPPSMCVSMGHVHWGDRLRLPSKQESGRSAEGGGKGGGACDGLATQRPPVNSCQGKHWPESDCATAGNDPKKANELRITAVAEKRVMLKPCAFPNLAEKNSNETPSAIQPNRTLVCDLADIRCLFGGQRLVCLGRPQRIRRRPHQAESIKGHPLANADPLHQ